MKILIILMALAPLAFAQDVLFEDNFDDGNADGWFEMATGATYEVNSDYRYELSYAGPDSDIAFSHRGDLGETMSEENYSVLMEIIGHYPTTITAISVRYMQGTGSAYTLYINYQYDTFYIYKYYTFISGSIIGSSVSFSSGFNYLTPYWVRFECVGSYLRAKIWTGPVSPEPTEWMIVRVDGTFWNTGCMAIESANLYGGDNCMEFDNVVVTSFPVSLESSTWGAIKNSF